MNEIQKLMSEALALVQSTDLSLRGQDWVGAYMKAKELQKLTFKIYMMTDTPIGETVEKLHEHK